MQAAYSSWTVNCSAQQQSLLPGRGSGCKCQGVFLPARLWPSQRQTSRKLSRAAASRGEDTKEGAALQGKKASNGRHLGSNGSSSSHLGASHRQGSSGAAEGVEAESGNQGKLLATLGLVAGVALLFGTGFFFKDKIRHFVDYFITVVDKWGPLGYLAYGVVYMLLEIVAVPAIPLTMTAGIIFGVVPGTIVVSAAATAAATIAFLIARYAARERIQGLAKDNPKFAAVDRAIGKQSLKVVTLLRLSPLLPLALSNYLYGLTSVDLGSYVLGSWLGMLPGTIAYVTAGNYGREYLDGGEAGLGVAWWQIALGAGATALALGYIGQVAKKALDEAEGEASA